jgi:hypothetical protein
MRPLGRKLSNFSDFESDLRANLSDKHVIGFLLDSRAGDLKRSGLILHPKAVLPLDNLLGQRATLFYPDPRKFEAPEYPKIVRDFTQNLLGSDYISFEVTTPAILLMTYRQGNFSGTSVLSFDSLPMCLWYSEIYSFIEEYLENHEEDNQDQQQGHRWGSIVQSHAGIIGVESLKACVGIFFNKIVSL